MLYFLHSSHVLHKLLDIFYDILLHRNFKDAGVNEGFLGFFLNTEGGRNYPDMCGQGQYRVC